jgi:hypothetical protein
VQRWTDFSAAWGETTLWNAGKYGCAAYISMVVAWRDDGFESALMLD